MEKSVKDANVYDKFQFERIGFFSVDPDASKKKVSFYLNEARNVQFLWLEIATLPSPPPSNEDAQIHSIRTLLLVLSAVSSLNPLNATMVFVSSRNVPFFGEEHCVTR